MNRLQKYFAILKITIRTIPVWSIYTILNSILGVICNILGSVILVDVVLTGISQNKSFVDIIFSVFIIQLIIMLGGFCTSIYYGKIDPIARQKLHKKITSRLIDNIMKTEMKNLDNSEFLDGFAFSINQIERVTTGSIFLVSNHISNIVGLISSILFIGFFSLELFFLVIIVAILSFLLNKAIVKIKFKFDNEVVLPNRKKSYVERVYHMKKFALEIRLYPISKFLQGMYNNAINDIMDIMHKYGLKIGILTFIRSYNQEIILYWGSMIIILSKFISGTVFIEPVSVVPVTVAICGLSKYILALTDIFNAIKEHELYSEKLFEFIHKPNTPQKKKPVASDWMHDISFHNVSFQYNKNEKFLLSNMNLKFSIGEKVAIVGANGSGKSTIIKLLLGLYPDYTGEINVNNEPILDFDICSFRELFSVVQQDFQQYPCTIAENVLMNSATKNDIDKIKAAFELVDLHLNLSDDELFTKPLTSEFCSDGLILSKGQYQKLALARVFASNKKIVVLDEPTSALDPISEYNVFSRLLEYFHEKTVIIISHRLTATKNADKIYMIENGKIIESGKHQQLMALGGKYAEMYSLQAEKYL